MIRFAEARFYFRANIAGVRETLALCSLYSPVDEQLCRESHGALKVFEYYGMDKDAVVVIPVSDIISVVAMIPFSGGGQGYAPWFFW
jgi:hypothetical protein